MKKYINLTICGLMTVMLSTSAYSAKADVTGDTPVTYTSNVINYGTITNLGVYKGVEIAKLSTEITDTELEEKIQDILAAKPEYVQITDRPAQIGDIVNIDYMGMMDGQKMEGAADSGYMLELGSGIFIDGFEDGLIGASIGDVRNLNLIFPVDYSIEELAGRPVVFAVTVHEIWKTKDATLDNRFVQEISDFNTVDEWTADILANMKSEKVSNAELQLEKDALLEAIKNSEFELNEAAVDDRFRSSLNCYINQIEQYGINLADYLSMSGMTEEQFKEKLRTSSELNIKQQLLAEAVAEKEGLKVEYSDLEALATRYKVSVDQLMATYEEESVKEAALLLKVCVFIKNNALIRR